jgi:hypothetical protein
LRELIANYQAIDPYLIAEIYAFRNQSDEAFEWLDRAYAKRDDGLIFTKVDPLLKSSLILFVRAICGRREPSSLITRLPVKWSRYESSAPR